VNEQIDYERTYFSWETFCEIVKSEWRYTFFLDEDSAGNSLPNSLSQIWNCFKQESNVLLTDLSPHTPIYRGRKFDKLSNEPYTAKMLGTPSIKNANAYNRFNPAGIPVFYGALDKKTAVEEIVGAEPYLVIGEFHNSKTIKVFDLVKAIRLSKAMLLSDDTEEAKKNDLLFFYSLAESLILSAENELDYIPTQIFAEYVRRVGFHDFGIRGIKYPSVKNSSGENVVLFYSNDECDDSEIEDKDCLVLNKTYKYARKVSYKKYKYDNQEQPQ